MTYLNATCTAEPDGFHLHEYQVGVTTITEHLHTWIDDHLAHWPDSARVYASWGRQERPCQGTAADVWAELSDQPLPAVRCQLGEVPQ